MGSGMELVIGIVACVICIVLIKAYANRKRREHLTEKYNDAEVVDKIMRKVIWQGMSEDQLIDSWGRPAAKDQKLYKTKTTEIFKYNQTGKNRFSNRVRVDNGFVVGWDKK